MNLPGKPPHLEVVSDAETGIMVLVVSGSPTIFHIAQWAADARDEEVVLWDFSKTDLSSIDLGHMRELARKVKPLAQSRKAVRVAILTGSTLALGLGRMFESFAKIETFPYEALTFNDRDKALAWLAEAPPAEND